MVSFFESVLSILRVRAQFSPFYNLVAQPVGLYLLDSSGQILLHHLIVDRKSLFM